VVGIWTDLSLDRLGKSFLSQSVHERLCAGRLSLGSSVVSPSVALSNIEKLKLILGGHDCNEPNGATLCVQGILLLNKNLERLK
jgi:hypothetical protein